MDEQPFDRVAAALNRRLAWVYGGVGAAATVAVGVAWLVGDTIVRHHRGDGRTVRIHH